MSEYQYYEFRTVRRPLSREEQEEVNTWSSRGEVTPTSASFVYHYSSFRQNPETCLLRCFDMMLCIANWGHRRLMFRFPEKEVDYDRLKVYSWEKDMEGSIQIYKKNGYVVIDIDENLEEGFDGWVEGEGILPALTPLWTDIYKGNYACLYLIWLHFEANYQELLSEVEDMDDFEDEDEVWGPPIPSGVKKGSTSLAEFMEFWDISDDLLSAASKVSPEPKTMTKAELEGQVRQLSEHQKTAFLVRLLLEDPHAVQMDLQKQLLKTSKDTATNTEPPRRNVQEILDLQKEHSEQRIAETQRLATEKRLKELHVLEKRQPQVWNAVRVNLVKRTSSGYDHAVTDLKELRDLAIHLNKMAEFNKKLAEFLEEFGRSKAFLERLKKAGLA